MLYSLQCWLEKKLWQFFIWKFKPRFYFEEQENHKQIAFFIDCYTRIHQTYYKIESKKGYSSDFYDIK